MVTLSGAKNWTEWVSEKKKKTTSLHLAWAAFSCTFYTPPLSLSVTMNKPVNRIFQSELWCPALRVNSLPAPLHDWAGGSFLMQWKIAMIPAVAVKVGAYQQRGFCWHQVEVHLYIQYIHHNPLVSFFNRENRKKNLLNLTNKITTSGQNTPTDLPGLILL